MPERPPQNIKQPKKPVVEGGPSHASPNFVQTEKVEHVSLKDLEASLNAVTETDENRARLKEAREILAASRPLAMKIDENPGWEADNLVVQRRKDIYSKQYNNYLTDINKILKELGPKSSSRSDMESPEDNLDIAIIENVIRVNQSNPRTSELRELLREYKVLASELSWTGDWNKVEEPANLRRRQADLQKVNLLKNDLQKLAREIQSEVVSSTMDKDEHPDQRGQMDDEVARVTSSNPWPLGTAPQTVAVSYKPNPDALAKEQDAIVVDKKLEDPVQGLTSQLPAVRERLSKSTEGLLNGEPIVKDAEPLVLTVEQQVYPSHGFVFGMGVPVSGERGKFGAQAFHKGLSLLKNTDRIPQNPEIQQITERMLKITGYVGESGLTEAEASELRELAEKINQPETLIPIPAREQLYKELDEKLAENRKKMTPELRERAKRMTKVLMVSLFGLGGALPVASYLNGGKGIQDFSRLPMQPIVTPEPVEPPVSVDISADSQGLDAPANLTAVVEGNEVALTPEPIVIDSNQLAPPLSRLPDVGSQNEQPLQYVGSVPPYTPAPSFETVATAQTGVGAGIGVESVESHAPQIELVESESALLIKVEQNSTVSQSMRLAYEAGLFTPYLTHTYASAGEFTRSYLEFDRVINSHPELVKNILEIDSGSTHRIPAGRSFRVNEILSVMNGERTVEDLLRDYSARIQSQPTAVSVPDATNFSYNNMSPERLRSIVESPSGVAPDASPSVLGQTIEPAPFVESNIESNLHIPIIISVEEPFENELERAFENGAFNNYLPADSLLRDFATFAIRYNEVNLELIREELIGIILRPESVSPSQLSYDFGPIVELMLGRVTIPELAERFGLTPSSESESLDATETPVANNEAVNDTVEPPALVPVSGPVSEEIRAVTEMFITPEATEAYKKTYVLEHGEEAWKQNFETYVRTYLPLHSNEGWLSNWFSAGEEGPAGDIYGHIVESGMTVSQFNALRDGSARELRNYLKQYNIPIADFRELQTMLYEIGMDGHVLITDGMTILGVLEGAFVFRMESLNVRQK